jgi:putative flippase GtrA
VALPVLIHRLVSKAREMFAAGAAGILGTAADVVVLMVLVGVGSSIPVSAFLAASVGAVVCFAINKYVAFQDHSPITVEQLGRFGFVAITNALALALLMKLVAVELGVPVLPAKLVCAAIVFFAWTYPAQKRLVFSKRATSGRAEAISPAQSLA